MNIGWMMISEEKLKHYWKMTEKVKPLRTAKVLLICMPWASTVRPNLGIGVLVSAARNAGYDCKSMYPNLAFSTLLGSNHYEYFAETPTLYPLAEHLFAANLFSADATKSDSYLASFLHKVRQVSEIAKNLNDNPLVTLRDKVIPDFLDSYAKIIQNSQANIVGFSCTFNQVLPSLALAKRLKELNPEIITLFGGACVHAEMGEAYARSFPKIIDHVFTGESDQTFIKFLDAYELGEEVSLIPGVTSNGHLVNSALPTPDLELVAIPDYDDYFFERQKLEAVGIRLAEFVNLPFESSRGCWWGEKSHCTFCGLNNMGMNYRNKSVGKIKEELLYLSQKYKTIHFMAADNILNYRGYTDLLPTIEQLPIDLNLFYEIKANIRRDNVAILSRAGVKWVQPGIESFSDHVLRLMKKGTTSLQNVQFIRLAQEFGLTVSYNILVGFPGELNQDYDEIIRVIRLISHLPPPSGKATLVQVHRFSPFHYTPDEYGIVNMRSASYYEYLVPSNIVNPNEIAYFFDRDIPTDASVLHRIDCLNDHIATWQNSNDRLVARLGAGFIEIQYSKSESNKIIQLDPLSSLILIYSDSVTTIKSIERKIKSLTDYDLASVRHCIYKLIEKELLISDKEKVLSLVPYEKSHSSMELESWVEYWFKSNNTKK